jgi:hypothetical protein
MTSRASKATSRAKTKTATSPTRGLSVGRQVLLFLSCLAAIALSVPTGADASDATLKAKVASWSQRIALDAHGIGLSASRRHPRRMMRRARHFRADSLRAMRALAPVRASSVRGRRAKRLAVAAFRDYAIVGREWALSGQARLRGLRLAAVGHARRAARFAISGSRLLVAAGKLLR